MSNNASSRFTLHGPTMMVQPLYRKRALWLQHTPPLKKRTNSHQNPRLRGALSFVSFLPRCVTRTFVAIALSFLLFSIWYGFLLH